MASEDVLDAAIVESILNPPKSYYHKKQKEELVRLREQSAQLTARLTALSSVKSLQDESSTNYWEKVARNQKMSTEMAVLENTRLKRALEEQLQIVGALEKLLIKKPRLATMPTMDLLDWKLRKLPTEPTKRFEAFNAMVNDAFVNLESLFVRTGVLEIRPDHRSINVAEENESIKITVKSIREIQRDFRDISAVMWAGLTGSLTQLSSHAHFEVLESFGFNATYIRITTSLEPGVPCLCLLYAVKRYDLEDKIVFVMKSVLEDEKNPVPSGMLIGNHTASMVIEPLGINRTCRRVCVEGHLPAPPPQEHPILQQDLSICDAVLKLVRPISEALESHFI
ncbi:hypothetical protein THRCLA_06987 [Thraustotheca clavata]|uniref:M96 mating-specific protein family n=1 Tax=Thraustotheca clavata TaxID=74557 RepID=A0A1V9ZHD1_9STRA|nr:hypothetical protein THRCLA_06987 [Thraustotheca clavata]